MAPPPTKKAGPASEFKTIQAQFAAAARAKNADDAAKAGRKPARAAPPQADAIERQRAKREAERKSTYDRRWSWTLGFWVWLLVVHAAGLYAFASGFLLSRLVLDDESTCAVNPLGIASSHTPDLKTGCWHPKTFERAVVVIIDALRYDFTVPITTDAVAGTTAEIFHNAFPFLYDTALSKPKHAFLRPFIADPPTATLQRLKGLTTGTLPTFMDLGRNFASTVIDEDNLLWQMSALNKTIVHLGDDTWTGLFPDSFAPNVSHAYDSFNVWDLHTVDNGVLEHIFPLVEDRAASPWDLLIGHLLGVDHAGHRYGPNHPAMREKLKQMNDFVESLAAAIDDDTLLVVMGDHGMDSKGDHGGESDDEVEAALWMYAKRPVFGRTSPEFVTPPPTAKQRPVNQIDLVPTLSLLLGLPIPFNNLGWPIEEAFIGPKGSNWDNLVTASEVTAAGISRYQAAYAAAQGVENAAETLPSPPSVASVLASRKFTASKTESLIDAYALLSTYQDETLRTCKQMWAKFNVPQMALGIAILALSAGVLVLYSSRRGDAADDDDESMALVEHPDFDKAELILDAQTEELARQKGTPAEAAKDQVELDEMDLEMHRLQTQHRSIVTAGLAGAAPVVLVWLVYLRTSEAYAPFGGCLAALTSTLAVLAQLVGVGNRRVWRLVPSSIWGWMALVFTASQCIGFASNSYTIWEDSILLFYLTTFGFVAGVYALRLPTKNERVLGALHAGIFIVLARMASVSRLCREEQLPYCSSTYYASSTSSTSAVWQLVIPYVMCLVMPSIVRSYFDSTKSYEGLAPTWVNYVFRGGLFGSALYWTLDAADNGDWMAAYVPSRAVKIINVYLSQTVLGLAMVAGTVAFVYASPCVSFSARAAPGTNRAQITVLGYANAHGARYLILVLNLAMAGVQLSKPMGGGALSLMLWQILSLLELLDVLKSGTNAPGSPELSMDRGGRGGSSSRGATLASIEEEDGPEGAEGADALEGESETAAPSSVGVIGPVILAMLAQFHFFTTGHQATLSSIQWDSAFIPLFEVSYPWSPVVVAGNTFPGHILAAAAVPLLVLWKTGPRRRGGLLTPASRALAGFAAYFCVEAVATMGWACLHRRHLMLFRVFSPRFMMAAAALAIADVAVIVFGLAGLRVNTMAVSEVFGWLDDY